MKKLLLSLLLTITTVFLGQAQGVRVGMRIGINRTTITGDNIAVLGKMGAAGGATLHLPLTKHFSIQPELLFSMQGYRYRSGGGGFGIGIRGFRSEAINYLHLPVLARVVVDGVFVEAGPQVGIRLSEDASPEGYHRLDIGAVVGVGYQFTDRVNVTVRYNHSLRTIYQASGASDPESLQGYHSVIQFTGGYTFVRR